MRHTLLRGTLQGFQWHPPSHVTTIVIRIWWKRSPAVTRARAVGFANNASGATVQSAQVAWFTAQLPCQASLRTSLVTAARVRTMKTTRQQTNQSRPESFRHLVCGNAHSAEMCPTADTSSSYNRACVDFSYELQRYSKNHGVPKPLRSGQLVDQLQVYFYLYRSLLLLVSELRTENQFLHRLKFSLKIRLNFFVRVFSENVKSAHRPTTEVSTNRPTTGLSCCTHRVR